MAIKIRKLNIAVHRDLGYFLSSLVIVYCISGIALNHINDWNPDFVIHKEAVKISGEHSVAELNDELIHGFGKLVGEESFKVYDMPTADQVKIYYDNGSLHLNLSTGTGVYEKLYRRPLFYHANVLHRNSAKGWRWASDVFAVMLITINVTGLFILKGKYGITGRGKWLIGFGVLPPLIALIVYEIM